MRSGVVTFANSSPFREFQKLRYGVVILVIFVQLVFLSKCCPTFKTKFPQHPLASSDNLIHIYGSSNNFPSAGDRNLKKTFLNFFNCMCFFSSSSFPAECCLQCSVSDQVKGSIDKTGIGASINLEQHFRCDIKMLLKQS